MITVLKNLLLRNVNTRQIVFKNTFWLGFSELISRALEFIVMISITRVLGATEFGKFTFALAFVSIFTSLSDLGISDIVTREIAHDREVENEYSAVFSLKVVLSVITFALMFIISFWITADTRIRLVICFLAAFNLVSTFFYLICAFLRAHQKMEYEAGITITRTGIVSIAVLLIIVKSSSIIAISLAYFFSISVALGLVLLFFHVKIKKLSWQFDLPVWKKFLTVSWPLGVAAVMGTVFVYMDSVMMGYFGQIDQNGWYNAARKIIIAITVIAAFFSASFYALLSNLLGGPKEKLQRAWNYYVKVMIILAFPTIAGGIVLAPNIIYFIFGHAFSPSIPVLKILMFEAGINFLYSPYALLLVVFRQQKRYFLINLVAALANIILNAILIPRYSLYGATMAGIVTYLILISMSVALAIKYTPIIPFNRELLAVAISAIFSSVVMYALLHQTLAYRSSALVLIALGIIVYFLCLFIIDRFFYKLKLLKS